jgi:hypothetical protein
VFTPDAATSVIVLASRASNNLYSLDNHTLQDGLGHNPRAHFVRYTIPVAGVTARIRGPEGSDIAKAAVSTLSGAEAGIEVDGDELLVTIPVLESYAAIKVDWEPASR